MRRQLFHVWLAAAAGGCLLAGCHSARQCPYPEEPLLLSKPPVEGKIEVQPGPQVARSEPVAPPIPAEALASIPRPLPVGPAEPVVVTPTLEPPRAEPVTISEPAPKMPTPVQPPVQGAPATMRKGPVPVTPTSRRRETPPAAPAHAPATPPVQGPELALTPAPQPVAGVFGHDAGYAWLQGTIDKHYRGRLYLRYCDPTVDERWGGKVCLEDDPRLAEFKDDDVLFVEGQLASEPTTAPRDGWRQYPHYKIKSVKLVQRKN